MFTESKPLIITKDNTTVKKLKITNPSGFAIIIKANNVTIQECDISGAINVYGAVHDILIQNNYIHDILPDGTAEYNKQFAGVTTTEGPYFKNPIVQPLGAANLTVRGNYFKNVPTGVLIFGNDGNIDIDGNYSENNIGPFPRGQICQIVKCKTTPDTHIIIENNYSFIDSNNPMQCSHQTNGRWGGEDHINCNASFGCAESPIIIRNNYLYGNSSSASNSGIMTGDDGGEYYHILNNVVYYTENCGIGVGGGQGNVIKGNHIYQDRSIAWKERPEARGIQIESYGTPFAGENLVEGNKVCFATAVKEYKYCSLLCRTDTAIFKDNNFCSPEEFGELDEFPPKEPSGAVEGLIKPWEIAFKTDYEII